MIDYLSGTVTHISENSVTLSSHGIGFSFSMPRTHSLELNKAAEVYVHMHWNAENGPTFFAFQTKLERTVFLLIIDCPGIGPKIALSILSQMGAEEFVHIITSHDEKKLNSVNGIGEKKAEQMILHLKRKVPKLLAEGELKIEKEEFAEMYTLKEALVSLGYSKQEINGALAHLSQTKEQSTAPSFDQLLRRALAYLSNEL